MTVLPLDRHIMSDSHVLDRGFHELQKARVVLQKRLRIIIAARRKAKQGQFNLSGVHCTRIASTARIQVEHIGAHAVHMRPSLQRRMLASEVPRSLMLAQTAFGLINVTTAVRRYPAATGAEPHEDGFVSAAKELLFEELYPTDEAKEQRIAVLTGLMADHSVYPAAAARLSTRQLSFLLASTTCAADTRRRVPGGDGQQLVVRLSADETRKLFLASPERVLHEMGVDPVVQFAEWHEMKCLGGVAVLMSGTTWHEMMCVWRGSAPAVCGNSHARRRAPPGARLYFLLEKPRDVPRTIPVLCGTLLQWHVTQQVRGDLSLSCMGPVNGNWARRACTAPDARGYMVSVVGATNDGHDRTTVAIGIHGATIPAGEGVLEECKTCWGEEHWMDEPMTSMYGKWAGAPLGASLAFSRQMWLGIRTEYII